MNNTISRFHGAVSKCTICSNAEGVPMHCNQCKSRGYIAVCTNCNGEGHTTVPVAGAASGDMTSTCPACGGLRCFGVNKPDGWVEPVAEDKKVLAVA